MSKDEKPLSSHDLRPLKDKTPFFGAFFKCVAVLVSPYRFPSQVVHCCVCMLLVNFRTCYGLERRKNNKVACAYPKCRCAYSNLHTDS